MNKEKETKNSSPSKDLKIENKESIESPKCGIVMPISAIDNLTAEHWSEVLSILKESINSSGFTPNLVSDSDESGIIQKRIIHNLYSNELVICDVSAKNPNVMFELGLRLAFDKPTIIIKDDKTDYTFDTSIIEHLSYPRDLRFSKINIFKESLKKKINATYEKSQKDSNYTTFLKHFGEYKIAQLAEKEVTSEKYILNALDDLKDEISIIRINQTQSKNNTLNFNNSQRQRQLFIENYVENYIKENNYTNKIEILLNGKENDLIKYIENHKEVKSFFRTRNEFSQFIIKYLEE
jgi:hypothetical protein